MKLVNNIRPILAKQPGKRLTIRRILAKSAVSFFLSNERMMHVLVLLPTISEH